MWPQREGSRIVVDASALAPEVATIDALARLALAARRLGTGLRVRDPAPALRELIALAGLEAALGVEPGRQAEEREQALGGEEECELGDAPA